MIGVLPYVISAVNFFILALSTFAGFYCFTGTMLAVYKGEMRQTVNIKGGRAMIQKQFKKIMVIDGKLEERWLESQGLKVKTLSTLRSRPATEREARFYNMGYGHTLKFDNPIV